MSNKPRPAVNAQGRDGFIVTEDKTGQEVHFVACDFEGRKRERCFAGLSDRTDWERFTVRDTRDGPDVPPCDCGADAWKKDADDEWVCANCGTPAEGHPPSRTS